MDIFIRYADIKGTNIGSICTRGASVRAVKPRILVGLERILVVLGVNDYCFLISMRLIFTLTKEPNYWCKKKLNLKNSHVFDIKYIIFYLWRLFLSQAKSCLLIIELVKY